MLALGIAFNCPCSFYFLPLGTVTLEIILFRMQLLYFLYFLVFYILNALAFDLGETALPRVSSLLEPPA